MPRDFSIASLVIEDTGVRSLGDENNNNPNNKLSPYKHVDQSFPRLLQRYRVPTNPRAHSLISRHVRVASKDHVHAQQHTSSTTIRTAQIEPRTTFTTTITTITIAARSYSRSHRAICICPNQPNLTATVTTMLLTANLHHKLPPPLFLRRLAHGRLPPSFDWPRLPQRPRSSPKTRVCGGIEALGN